jgi:prolyl-tRNA synthetase
MELVGIPHRVVLGERGLDKGQVEYKGRRDEETTLVDTGALLGWLLGKLGVHK